MRGDELERRVREALRAGRAAAPAQLIAQARQEAEDRVRAMLAEAFTDALLEAVITELPAGEQLPGFTSRRRGRRGHDTFEAAGHDDLGLYVYCVISAWPGEEALPPHVAAIDPGYRLQLIVQGDLAAVVSAVPLAEFGEEELRARLADGTWLESAVRAHEAVLEGINEETTVVPMHLCTVVSGPSGVREMLLREQQSLAAALTHLDHRSEWGVKVFAPQPRSAAPRRQHATPAAETEFRRRQRERRQRRSEELHQVCASIHAQLSAAAVDAHVSPPQRRDVTGRDAEMLLNGVYLVDDDELPRFLELVEALNHEHGPQGLEVEPTGPWPAYNFVPSALGAVW